MPESGKSQIIMRDLSYNLRRLMQERGLSQVELERKSGVDQTLISRYLSGEHHTQYYYLQNLMALSEALGVTLYELTGHEGFRSPGLTKQAREFLELFEKLSAKDKKAVIKIMKGLLEGK
jgi:transcriptional regulator with XRE-family HTH domain